MIFSYVNSSYFFKSQRAHVSLPFSPDFLRHPSFQKLTHLGKYDAFDNFILYLRVAYTSVRGENKDNKKDALSAAHSPIVSPFSKANGGILSSLTRALRPLFSFLSSFNLNKRLLISSSFFKSLSFNAFSLRTTPSSLRDMESMNKDVLSPSIKI